MHAGAVSPNPLPLSSMARKSSDARSLSELVSRNFPLVWRAARRLGLNESDADDAAQQVCLVLARRLPEIEPGKERSFMFGAVLKVVSRMRRSQSRRHEVSGDELEGMPSTCPGPDAALDRHRTLQLLDRVLNGLEDEQRTVFVLHEIEHLTMQEIADVLEIPSGTVASRLRRAREQFNRRLRAFKTGVEKEA